MKMAGFFLNSFVQGSKKMYGIQVHLLPGDQLMTVANYYKESIARIASGLLQQRTTATTYLV